MRLLHYVLKRAMSDRGLCSARIAATALCVFLFFTLQAVCSEREAVAAGVCGARATLNEEWRSVCAGLAPESTLRATATRVYVVCVAQRVRADETLGQPTSDVREPGPLNSLRQHHVAEGSAAPVAAKPRLIAPDNSIRTFVTLVSILDGVTGLLSVSGPLLSAFLVCALWGAGLGAVRGRRPEFELLRALGFSAEHIIAVVLAEAVLHGAVGGLAGMAAGAALALSPTAALDEGFAVQLGPTWGLLLKCLSLSILMGFLLGGPPASVAASMSPQSRNGGGVA